MRRGRSSVSNVPPNLSGRWTIFLYDLLAPPHLMHVFSPASVDPLLSMLEAADLSFAPEFLAVAIISF